ncbi:hypothetical protein V8F20_010627 [Naviculisporaceae sp. PSN 640]
MDDPSFTGLPGMSLTDERQFIHRLTSVFPIPIGGGRGASSGIDAAVLVIRRMIATGVPISEDNQAQNPLLRYALRDFKGASEEATRAEQKRLLADFDKTFTSRSFEQIMLSEIMLKTLWVTPQAALFSTNSVRRHRTDEQFSLIRDQVDLPEIRMAVARDSLVRWDGSQPLSQAVQERFGFHESADEEFVTLNNPGAMLWLRVWYTPGPGVTNPPGWKDIRQWQINPKGFVAAKGENGEPLSEPKVETWGKMMFSLSAVVRLRSLEEEEDYCRVYQEMGEYVPLEGPREISQVPYLNNDWRIGQPGYTYALFFKRVTRPLMGTALEVYSFQPLFKERVDFLDAECDKLERLFGEQSPTA